jgi:indole-3-glycerol phosphate synthase
VLCEVHDEQELDRALDTGCEIIGVNSRNLKTFEVDHDVLRRLAPKIPNRALRVAESGIQSGAEMRELANLGYEAFLVGESLMRADSPGAQLAIMTAQFHSATAKQGRSA